MHFCGFLPLKGVAEEKNNVVCLCCPLCSPLLPPPPPPLDLSVRCVYLRGTVYDVRQPFLSLSFAVSNVYHPLFLDFHHVEYCGKV
ncbi:hypothetical protein ABB37_00497 [Leptomonas pyrrhocoris]|uniref:Uncharacterized protein n=1 Tax=Leptomonas pyrrhocoris TaxID=157538 RepID=A0A0M9GAN8_LEPPY|nr:hypothetical protein ABB37_00497 [Leptomonas pyrrhocoris]KPA86269.1 hypothetical protein ABB37_00497 [Leptomonas pyrrhocoris]|eukprot:XP_015664708.1 hypothetical protein ABB37_00497 [Leptomonas pyrrhocoris]